ncbi:polysaccharide pyruvyl transferase family protein, partial [bacterium]|nr:polysaccharide pyruvyl transferase family protein [bacterium]
MSTEKIILIGNGPFLNRGCEAIVEGTLKIIENSFNNACVKNYYFARNTNQDDYNSGLNLANMTHNITHCPIPWMPEDKRYSWTWILSQIGRKIAFHDLGYVYYNSFQKMIENCVDDCDVALQIGGDNYTLDYGFPLKHAAIDATLSKKGISVVLWGASVGPFNSRPQEEKWLIKHIRNHIRLILVREPETLDYLRKINLGDRTHQMGDPAFVMDPSIPPEGLIDSDSISGAIGLNLSPLLSRYRKSDGGM